MNLVWVAALAIAVLVEEAAAVSCEWTARIAGLLLMGWGLWLLAAG